MHRLSRLSKTKILELVFSHNNAIAINSKSISPQLRCTADGPSVIPSISNLKLHQQRMERNSNFSDDEPLYDAVASDDDYAALTPIAMPSSMHQQVNVMHLKDFKMNSIG